MRLTLPLVLLVLTTATPLLAQSEQSMPGWERKLLKGFENRVLQSMVDSSNGCIDCHSDEGTSSLILSGNAIEDFRRLLDDGYLGSDGPDTLLARVTSSNPERRMPKGSQPWSDSQIQGLRTFLKKVTQLQDQGGFHADEQFPRSLLSEYAAVVPGRPPTEFVSYRQLRAKILAIFDDDWVRGDRDLFSENIAAFGGADFKTRFNESTSPNAAFLSALELLSRDVASRAYRMQTGPFENWVEPSRDPLELPNVDPDFAAAISSIYQNILFRTPSNSEVVEAFKLIRGVHDLRDSIAQRSTELTFEVTVTDPITNMSESRTIQIPISGDLLSVRQGVLDQRPKTENHLNKLAGKFFRPILDRLAIDALGVDADEAVNRQVVGSVVLPAESTSVDGESSEAKPRVVIHNKGTIRNVSFAGIELLDADGKVARRITVDAPEVRVEGAWELRDEDGFKSFEDGNRHKGLSTITVPLESEQPGEYHIAILWRPGEKNANNVLVELFGDEGSNRIRSNSAPKIPAEGLARFHYDCSDDAMPFVELAPAFQFSQESFIEVSNRATLDQVTVGAIELVEAANAENNFLIDSKDAVGVDQWQKFDEGRFKAYNVRGLKLHDDNRRKGELSLRFALSDRQQDGWHPDRFYRVRVFYPGKRDQEPAVPVDVHAVLSSPIVQVAAPLTAKSDARLRLDASASYTVQGSSLEFSWRQVSGPTVTLADTTGASIEFAAPRLAAPEVAWTALCSALLRHPDFLFTRPPSIDAANPSDRARLQLMKLALDLVGRPPTPAEFSQLQAEGDLEQLVEIYLNSDEFRDFYFHRIRLYLESQGTPVQDEPARLWSYIAFEDRPFQEILTADYSVDEDSKRVTRPAYHGKTGVLTTQGFIQGKPGLPHYNYAAQVSMLFLGYVYEVPAEIVDQREGVTALGTTDPNSVCYSCHKVLTPLSFQRLNWTDEGLYEEKGEDGQDVDASDRDVVPEYPFKGVGLEAFATQAATKERFIRTMLNTHVSFYFGRPMHLFEEERGLYKRLWENVHTHDFKIRELIRCIVTSPEYLGSVLDESQLSLTAHEPLQLGTEVEP